MLSKSATMRNNTFTPVFLASSLVLLFILFIRTTRGLDLTDEMQYYGEIRALIETGGLFSSDLFIQQSVYILLYPIFYFYHLIFGFDGLVFFGRMVMSILSVGIFIYAYQKLVVQEFPKTVASLTALSLTFAIPYHGIFAPSYNTISQILWIVFALKFFEWKRSSTLSFGILPVIMAFAHPTSAVMIALLVFARLFTERKFVQIGKLALVFLGGALIALPTALYFAPLQDYVASLNFSSGYGVGAAFFSNREQPIALVAIYAVFASCALVWTRLNNSSFSISTALILSMAIYLFWGEFFQWGYSPQVVCFLSLLTALAYVWALSSAPVGDTKIRKRIHWLATLILMFATTLGVTSGNGIGQATGAFMVGLPLLLGIAVTSSFYNEKSGEPSFIKVACVFLMLILFVVHWSRYPYREDSWWTMNDSIESVSEFRFIKTSSERSSFIRGMQKTLGQTTQNKRTLIISEYPALYFALDTMPETCMLYMHSVTSDKSEKALLECFEKKSPQVIVDISTDKGMSSAGSRMKKVMRSYYLSNRYNCDIGSVRFDSDGDFNPAQLKISVCKQVV